MAARRVSDRSHTDSRSLQSWLLGSLPGRVLLGAAGAKVLLTLVAPAGGRLPLLGLLNAAVTLALVVSLGYFLVRLLAAVRRRLLWRVRRKLILSYVFIGFVPVLLIVAFFLLAGLLMFLNFSSYLVKNGFDDLVDEATVLAQTSASEIRRGAGVRVARQVLDRKLANVVDRYGGASLALVPRGHAAGMTGIEPVTVGPWGHAEPPRTLPSWVGRSALGVLLVYQSADTDDVKLVVRAVSLPDERDPAYGIVVDLPVDDQVNDRLRESTGIKPGEVAIVNVGGDAARPARGRRRPAEVVWRQETNAGTRWGLNWVSFIDYSDWDTGRTGKISISIQVRLADMFERISGTQAFGPVNLGQVVLMILAVIGVLFLVIEAGALVMGFALARSITGSVHELFAGTERVRRGDFTHRIRVETRDQLGELAESFNQMTASVEDLLVQAAEKKRLEEELRIARRIQMSLLPSGPVKMPGVAITALCVPAREVGGDYYDFFPLGERRLGILIADVSGKGTSAALYMAELKGLVLALSQICQSPKQLLVDVNRIIADNLDSRSFITATYAVLDLDAGSLTYARAGHTPLIYLPATEGRQAQVLTPDGLVLGLRLDGFPDKFDELLEERRLSVSQGDVLVFFTDGVTEAMNEHSDLFGEARLSRLIEAHGHLASEDLRERIWQAIEAFVGGADQHDDITMILVKIGEAGVPMRRRAAVEATV